MSVSSARSRLAETGERLAQLHQLLCRAWMGFDEGTLVHEALYAAYMAVEEIGWGEGAEADRWLGVLESVVGD